MSLKVQLMAAEQKRRIGERIRAARESRGWTQGDLARELPGRVESSQVSRWERGLVQPQPDNLDAIARALGRDVSYFLVESVSVNGDGAQPTDDGDVLSRLVGLQSAVEGLRESQSELLQRVAALAEEAVETRREVRELREVLRVRRQSG